MLGRKSNQIRSRQIEFVAEVLFVPVNFPWEVIVKYFEDVVQGSYIMAFKQLMTKNETSPKTVLDNERASCNKSGNVLVIFIQSAELRNQCHLLFEDLRV